MKPYGQYKYYRPPTKGEARMNAKKIIAAELQLIQDDKEPYIDTEPCYCDYCLKIPHQIWDDATRIIPHTHKPTIKHKGTATMEQS